MGERQWKVGDTMEKSVEAYLNAIRKEFRDEGVAFAAGETNRSVEFIPSNIPSLDAALGGGIPRGRIVEIFGPESGGKTTLALQFAVQAQLKGGFVHFIDMEHALDVDYAAALGWSGTGVISQPDCGETAIEIAQFAIGNHADVIVIDSVAALVPKAELEGEVTDQAMGSQARLMSKGLRMLSSTLGNTTIIFVNQIRHKIGVFYGNPETTPGGNALKFYASVRMDVRRGDNITADGDPTSKESIIGHKMKIKVVKNKVAMPYKSCEVNLIYGKGFDISLDLIQLCVRRGILRLSGSWVYMNDRKIANGIRAAAQVLESDAELRQQLMSAINARTSVQ
jgi:recombination protein RecA